MAETHDTIKSLLAEFSGYAAGMPASYHVTMSWHDFLVMLDRLEAAHKREVREAVTGSNQLREALKRIVAASIVAKNANAPEWILQRMADIFAMATTALAAPTRNCDRFATVDEARKAQGDCAMILEV
ncbi:MAG: hypothetical protein IIY62_00575 [Kiritimatiellae bacterium]|nr:hypothetical protein [Kiritimatiellia bacterium]